MTYTQQPKDGAQALDDMQANWRDQGYGVIDPGTGALAVSVDTGTLDATDTLSVASGQAYVDNTVVDVAQQSVGISSVGAISGDTAIRFDTIWVDASGTVQKEEGTVVELSAEEESAGTTRFDAVSPVMPFPSTTPATVLAAVVVTEDDGSVASDMVQDRRITADLAANSLASQSVSTAQIDNSGSAVNFNDPVSIDSQNALLSVAASGQTTLSSGSAVVDTGLSVTDATFYLALGIDDPDADAKIAGRLFWDDSAGTNSEGAYKVEIVEDGTSIGNPTVNYDILRVR